MSGGMSGGMGGGMSGGSGGGMGGMPAAGGMMNPMMRKSGRILDLSKGNA